MTLYRVWARYEPDFFCNLTGRRGQWRVTDSMPNYWNVPFVLPCQSIGELSIASTKPYRKGCIIRPHKELNRVLAARRSK